MKTMNKLCFSSAGQRPCVTSPGVLEPSAVSTDHTVGPNQCLVGGMRWARVLGPGNTDQWLQDQHAPLGTPLGHRPQEMTKSRSIQSALRPYRQTRASHS